MRRSTGVWALLLLGLSLTGAACSRASAGRNCLVIPAQLELVQERREAALKELENKATSVDRMRASLERAQERLQELQAEKAMLQQMDQEKGQEKDQEKDQEKKQ
jgi:hypothetical protein